MNKKILVSATLALSLGVTALASGTGAAQPDLAQRAPQSAAPAQRPVQPLAPNAAPVQPGTPGAPAPLAPKMGHGPRGGHHPHARLSCAVPGAAQPAPLRGRARETPPAQGQLPKPRVAPQGIVTVPVAPPAVGRATAPAPRPPLAPAGQCAVPGAPGMQPKGKGHHGNRLAPPQPGQMQPGTAQPGTARPTPVQPGQVRPAPVQPGGKRVAPPQPGQRPPAPVRPGGK